MLYRQNHLRKIVMCKSLEALCGCFLESSDFYDYITPQVIAVQVTQNLYTRSEFCKYFTLSSHMVSNIFCINQNFSWTYQENGVSILFISFLSTGDFTPGTFFRWGFAADYISKHDGTLLFKNIPELVYNINRNTKLIVIMRDPVTRWAMVLYLYTLLTSTTIRIPSFAY